MVDFTHYGLYFTAQQAQAAHTFAKRRPLDTAWAGLDADTPTDPLAATVVDALRYRLRADDGAAQRALHHLNTMPPLDVDTPLLTTIENTLAMAQAYELLRAYPGYAPHQQALWREGFMEQVAILNERDSYDLLHLERIWLALLNLVAGIVLERPPIFQQGAAVYEQVVTHDIRPQGYIPQAVEDSRGGSMARFVLSVKALTLMAAAAQTVGVDLWGMQSRGISVVTAGLYPLYYYFYPEKWQWDEGITLEDSAALFGQHGGYLELVNQQLGRRIRAVDLVLKQIRPVLDPYGGGALTLSHGVPQRRGLFG
ncbi:MAG: alginate lyase family protein [Armatimonadetes bacterium]|nr:alginate lyase family protein [Anaerolineae bacterium]